MRIKIDLEYILSKNRVSLKKFLENNSISSYSELLAYCEETNMNPVDESTFDATVNPKPVPKPEPVAEKPFAPPAKPKKKAPAQKKTVAGPLFNEPPTPQKEEKSIDEKPKKATKRRNTRRTTSETQAKKRGRGRPKKVKST